MHSQQLQPFEAERGRRSPALASPNVLVAQPSPDDRGRLVSVLRQAFPRGSIIVSERVHESLDVLDELLIDIALISPRLLDGSGLHMIQRCFRSSPLTRCVITTAGDSEAYLMQALAAGAVGCLIENQPDAVLIEQLRLLAEGIPPLAPPIAARLLYFFTARPPRFKAIVPVDAQSTEICLSKAEERVLSLIAAGTQIGDVAQALEISTHDVCGHVKSIYAKRHQASRADGAIEFQYPSVA